MSPSQASSSSPCFSSGWPRLEYFHAAQKFTNKKTLWPPKLCKFSQNTGVTSKIEISALIGLDWNLFCLNWIGSGNFWLNSSLAPLPPDFQTFLQPSTSTFYYSSFPPAPINLRGLCEAGKKFQDQSEEKSGESSETFQIKPTSEQWGIRSIASVGSTGVKL